MFIKSSFPSSFTCFPNQRLSPPHNISIFLLLHLSAKISSMAKALSRISFFLTINSDKNMVSKTPVFFLIFSLEIYTTKYMCVSNLFYDFFSCFWVISPICFRGILSAEKNNKEIMRERERCALGMNVYFQAIVNILVSGIMNSKYFSNHQSEKNGRRK